MSTYTCEPNRRSIHLRRGRGRGRELDKVEPNEHYIIDDRTISYGLSV